MANHCSNYIVISGAPEAVSEIEKVLQEIKNGNEHLWYDTFAKTLGLNPSENHEFGTKWFDFYMEKQTDGTLQLSGDSAWGPPTEWLLKLSDKFNVSIESEYDECGNDFAGYYNCENGIVTKDDQMKWFVYRLKEDRESAIENAYCHLETFEEFLEEMGEDIKLLTEEETEEVKNELNTVKN